MLTDTAILTINCGSSSVKYQVFNWDKKLVMAKGTVEKLFLEGSRIIHERTDKPAYKKEAPNADHNKAIELIVDTLTDKKIGVLNSLKEIKAVGHRVVHGGEHFSHPVVITDEVLKAFDKLSFLAPLHNPPNIIGIKAAQEALPNVPHVAVMDTSFFYSLPPKSYIYAVPYEWYEKYKVRRYGFHGTSHLYVARRAAVMLGKEAFDVNLITCHIGNGVSITAIKDGRAYDHSMGFTPLEGLIMGTRSGDMDPAIIPYIIGKTGMTVEEVESILNKKSGLLGVTGKYIDRRDIMKAAQKGEKRAELALEIERHRIKKYLGAYCAILGRVDAIVFTAGAGEMDKDLRENVCHGLEQIGIIIDTEKNNEAVSKNKEFVISADHSPIKIFVIPTDEELVFTEEVVAIIEGRYNSSEHLKYSFEDANYINKMRNEAYQRELLAG